MNNIVSNATGLINNIREAKPLVHHITNYVTVNDCANITLAIGASPIMADDIEEVQEIIDISQSLVLNIGTLNNRTIDSMLAAGKKANERKIPVVLDPVGAGVSKLRNKTVNKLLEQINFSVIRGNMSEIRFIAGLSATTKGVDASETDLAVSAQNGVRIAKSLADKLGCVIAITGATDIISSGKQTVCIENGHKMLGAVTGTGCMCSSLIGSFCGASTDYFIAATSGILCMGIAGEIAFENVGQKGNGAFHMGIMDEISKLNAETLIRRANIYEA
jgi:hydroxyethylthiazole kinase